MCRHRALGLALLAMVACAPVAAAGQVTLVSPETAATIVVDHAWQAPLADAIADLHRCLGLISGRTLPPATTTMPAAGPRIVITADAPGAAELDGQRFRLRAGGDTVTIAASDPMGASHGIYDLLDQLGCRWYFAGDIWEEVPRHQTVVLPEMAITRGPSFMNRSIWYGWGVASKQAKIDYQNWCRRNRLGSWLEGGLGHAYANIATPADDFAEHPDWFPLIDGKRHPGGQLCLSHPAVQQRAIDYVRDYFSRRADARIVSLSPNDGRGYCQCDGCAAWGSISDQTVRFANIVAQAVHAEYPDRYLGMYAYSDNAAPPTLDVHPAVVIYIATAYIKGGWSFDELLEGWSAKASRIGVRAYYDVTLISRDTPRWYVDLFRERIPRYHASNVVGISAESGCNWGAQGINYYIAARLMWDHEADVDALMTDFYRRCWGPAEAAMRDYYVSSQSRQVTPEGLRHLQAAAELAPTDSRYERRVDLYRLYAHFAVSYRRHLLAQSHDERITTARKAMHLSWRLRDYSLVHTQAHFRENRLWRLGDDVPAAEIERWKVDDAPPQTAALPDAAALTDGDGWASLEAPEPAAPKPFFTHVEIDALIAADLATFPTR